MGQPPAQPKDLTPADTSSFITPTLAAAVRAHQPHVDEFITSHPRTAAALFGTIPFAGPVGGR